MFHDGFFMGGMWFGWIFWIIIIGAVIYLIVRLNNQNSRFTQHSESALDILKKRYAKGEISKEEFEEKKKDIE